MGTFHSEYKMAVGRRLGRGICLALCRDEMSNCQKTTQERSMQQRHIYSLITCMGRWIHFDTFYGEFTSLATIMTVLLGEYCTTKLRNVAAETIAPRWGRGVSGCLVDTLFRKL